MKFELITISLIIFLLSFFQRLRGKNYSIEVLFYFSWFLLFISLFVSTDYEEIFIEDVINFSSLMFFVWLTLLPPLLFCIVEFNISKRKINIKHFYIPALLFFINIFSLMYFSVQKDETSFTYEVVKNVMTYSNYITILFIFPISTIYYSFLAFREIGKYPTIRLFNEDSQRFYLFLFVMFYDLYIVIWIFTNYILSDLGVIKYLKMFYFIYFIVSYYILWMSKKSCLLNEKVEESTQETLFLEIDEKLTSKLVNELAFLDFNLNVKDLANEIGTNEKYLSQVINKKYNKNFSNFINDYRIIYAKELLLNEEYSNYTIEAIGNLSGFNSKTTFNSTFKKLTGVTPSGYKKGAN